MSTSSPQTDLPASGRIIGIDFGTVRIGIAITDPSQRIASPLENYNRRSPPLDLRYLVDLLRGERAVGIVMGLPVHMSGDESQMSHQARKFGAELSEASQLPVVYFDERFSSAIAEELLQGAGLTKKKRKARLDKLAAQILLMSWLESSRKNEGNASVEDRH